MRMIGLKFHFLQVNFDVVYGLFLLKTLSNIQIYFVHLTTVNKDQAQCSVCAV